MGPCKNGKRTRFWGWASLYPKDCWQLQSSLHWRVPHLRIISYFLLLSTVAWRGGVSPVLFISQKNTGMESGLCFSSFFGTEGFHWWLELTDCLCWSHLWSILHWYVVREQPWKEGSYESRFSFGFDRRPDYQIGKQSFWCSMAVRHPEASKGCCDVCQAASGC